MTISGALAVPELWLGNPFVFGTKRSCRCQLCSWEGGWFGSKTNVILWKFLFRSEIKPRTDEWTLRNFEESPSIQREEELLAAEANNQHEVNPWNIDRRLEQS